MVDEGDGVSREQGWRTATVRTQEMEDERGRRVIDLVDLVNWWGVRWVRSIGSDVADASKPPHIRPRCGLDLRGAEQPRHIGLV